MRHTFSRRQINQKITMLDTQRISQIDNIINNYNHSELLWLSGYFYAKSQPNSQAIISPERSEKITIIYGSETGNAKILAENLNQILRNEAHKSKILTANEYNFKNIYNEKFLIIITSTHGDGDAPENAKKFYDKLSAENDKKLTNLKFAILSLGDSSYPYFCKTGTDIYDLLLALNAKNIAPLLKLDVDYQQESENWLKQIKQYFQQKETPQIAQFIQETPKIIANKYNAKNPAIAEIISNIKLNDVGSNKATFHLAIENNAEIKYQPGDALAIIPHNQTELVTEIIKKLEISKDEKFKYRNIENSITDILSNHAEIRNFSKKFLLDFGNLIGQELKTDDLLSTDLLELVTNFKIKDVNKFIAILQPLKARLYSIASAESYHDLEIHILVSKIKYQNNNRRYFGTASKYLSEITAAQKTKYYLQPNQLFKLPADNRDIIMIGPGTGIAPFRSFLFHRAAENNSGKNWLFFGEQHKTTDFYYQRDLQQMLKDGVLTKLNVAFSRDSQKKIYVQDKLLEHGKEIFSWLENGANLYICGKKDPTSYDIENTLISIIAKYGNHKQLAAEQYLQNLSSKNRYLKDVY
jgi:sulfite reductase (NADPH) flavoprotein alpha-component